MQFDPKNSLHLDYVRYSACLWAKVWGVVPTHHDPRNEADNDYLRKICEEVPVPAFQPKQNKVIETDENAKKEDIEAKIQQAAEFDEAAFNAAIDRIKELLVHKEKYQMFPEEFEKVTYIAQTKSSSLLYWPDRVRHTTNRTTMPTSTSISSRRRPTCAPTTTPLRRPTGSRQSALPVASCLPSPPPRPPFPASYVHQTAYILVILEFAR